MCNKEKHSKARIACMHMFNLIVVTEQLHFHFSLSCIGERNGNLLQCSCLENPRDGQAWWASVYGVAQSRTRLKQLSSSSSSFFLNLFLLGISFSYHPPSFLFCECVWIGFTKSLPTSVCLAPKYPLLFEDCAASPICLVSWPHISNRVEIVLALFFAWMTWQPAWRSAFVARCVSYNHLRAWANGFLSEPTYFPPHWSRVVRGLHTSTSEPPWAIVGISSYANINY